MSDNTAMGHPAKYAPGGEMSYRVSDGQRVNQWGKVGQGRGRRQNGDRKPSGAPSHRTISAKTKNGTTYSRGYTTPALANPGNLVKTNVGGGHLGDRLAHENEAPFPEKLAEWFIRSLCPTGGIVLDPFSGSGTTAKVAASCRRDAIGIDIRISQVALSKRRTATIQPELY